MRTISSFPRHEIVRRLPQPGKEVMPHTPALHQTRHGLDNATLTGKEVMPDNLEPAARDNATAPVRAGADPFERWWKCYPHKIGKGAARKSFAKAIGKASLEQLVLGVERYKKTKPADRDWCHPATWLNQERWTDVPAETNGQAIATTVDEVVTGLFNGYDVIAKSFRSDILVRAGELDLGRPREADLAARLGALYNAIRRERANRTDGTSGPMDLLRRYLIWLGEQDWPAMTMRVLSIDCPAFGQFRREEAHRHPYGADPLTGR